jgi:hypothetical protein
MSQRQIGRVAVVVGETHNDFLKYPWYVQQPVFWVCQAMRETINTPEHPFKGKADS